MVRQEQVRRRGDTGPDGEPQLDRLPRRPLTDTRPAAQLLDRIRRLLTETRKDR